MKFNIGDKVRIVPPNAALPWGRKGACATIVDCYTDGSISYTVVFPDGLADKFYETWLEKVEEGTNIHQQPTAPPMPKKEMDWSQIKEMTEMALAHNKDITITINADGSKEVEISTPTTSIVESQMRTRYVPEGGIKND